MQRLSADHENAARLAELIAGIPGIDIDVASVETNMVYFDTSKSGLSAPEIHRRLLDRGVRIGAIDERLMRAVTHIDVDRQGVQEAASALREIVVA